MDPVPESEGFPVLAGCRMISYSSVILAISARRYLPGITPRSSKALSWQITHKMNPVETN